MKSAESAEEPHFFEHGGARLFGAWHWTTAPSRDTAVVFCHPYGEEKQFSYRIFVQFARRLAAASIPSFRFDGLGYGDSEGDQSESTVEGQIGEVGHAVDRSIEAFGAPKVILVGLRLGATVAALVAERDPRVQGLVLWSPIADGTVYLGELLRKRLLSGMLEGRKGETRESLVEALGRGESVEVEGGLVTPTVGRELREIDLAQSVGFEGPVFMSATPDRRGRFEVEQRLADRYRSGSGTCSLTTVEASRFWEDRPMSKWYTPVELFDETLEWIRAL